MPDTAPDRPHPVLGHRELTGRTYNTRTYTTWYTPLQFPRPAAGVTEYQVTCSHCGRVVRWRVLSEARASARSWTWAGLVPLSIAAFIVPLIESATGAASALPILGAVVVFPIALYQLSVEPSIRVLPARRDASIREWRTHRAVTPRRSGVKDSRSGVKDTGIRDRGRLQHSVGIETEGGRFTPLIPKGVPLPASVTETFTTAVPDQPSIELRAFQGENLRALLNNGLGVFAVTQIPPAGPGELRIYVTFHVDA